MAINRQWYADRIGQAASAQSTEAQPRPDYALATSLGTSPMPDASFREMNGAVQWDAQQYAEDQKAREVMAEAAANLQQFTFALSEGVKNKRNTGFDLFRSFDQDDDMSFWESTMENASSIVGGIGSGIGAAGSAIMDAGQWVPNLIGSALDDEKDFSEVSEETREARSEGTMQALEKADEYVFTPAQRGIATPFNVANIEGERGLNFWESWSDPDVVAEAWGRTAKDGLDVTWGRAAFDAAIYSGEERDAIYSQGVDEDGRPVDDDYRKMREENLWYNLGSGTLDFAATWFADPLVVAGKAATSARAVYKGDLDRMGARSRAKFLDLTTISDEAFNSRTIRPHDVVGRRAATVRREQDELRDRIRSGELDGSTLQQTVQGFEQSPMAAEAFRRGALIPRLDGNGYDNDAFRTVVRGIMSDTSADARRVLESDRRYVHVRDMMDAMGDQQKIRALDAEIAKSDELIQRYEQPDSFGTMPMESHLDPDLFSEIQKAKMDLPEQRLQAQSLRQTLDEYTEHERWWNGLFNSIEEGTITMAPRGGASAGETFFRSFRPNPASSKTHSVIGATKSAFLRRPGVLQFHDGNQFYHSVDRYFDSMSRRSGSQGQRVLDESALQRSGGEAQLDFDGFRRDFMNRSLAASSDVERRMLSEELEDFALEALSRKHGLDTETAGDFAAAFKAHKSGVFDDLQRKHEMPVPGERVPRGFSSYSIAEGDNVVEHLLPLSSTELRNTGVLTDLQAMDSFLGQHAEGISNAMRNYRTGRNTVRNYAEQAMGWYTRFWKPSVLFRLGYVVRNITDEMLRGIAVASEMPTLIGHSFAAGTRGALRAAHKGGNRAIRRAGKSKFAGRRARHWVEENWNTLDDMPSMARYGEKSTTVRGTRVPGIYEPGTGDVYRGLNSSSQAFRRFATMQDETLRNLRSENINATLVNQHDRKFASSWKERLEKHIATDPIDRMMLDDFVKGRNTEQTDAAIRGWLAQSSEGRKMRNRMKHTGGTTEWIQKRRERFNENVPDRAVAQRLLDNKSVSEDDLRTILRDRPQDAPSQIDAMSDQMVTGAGRLSDAVNRTVEKIYDTIAAMPVDMLVRHPFANQQYRAMMARQIDALDIPKNQPIPDDLMNKMADTARRHSVKQTRRYMFNLQDTDTNMVNTMRFMSPFMGAWQESMIKWGRLITERPESLARIWVNGWMDTEDLYGVEHVTEDGYTAEQEARVAAEEGREEKPANHIRTPLLGRAMEDLDFLLPGDQTGAAQIFKHAQFNKNNANVITQGDHWYLPGMGPIVQGPLQATLGDNPEWDTEEGVKGFLWDWAIAPVGKQEAMDYLVPSSTLQAIHAYLQDEGNEKFRSLSTRSYQHMYSQWVNEGRIPEDKPTQAEADGMAKATMAFNALGRFATPAAYQAIPTGEVELESGTYPGQFLIDQSRLFDEMYGWEEGPEKFIEEYGQDAYMWLTSMSGQQDSLPPTGRSWKGWKRYKDQIADVPELGLAIIGMDAADDEFNMAVYQEQKGLGKRHTLTAEEWSEKTEQEQGWREWTAWKTALDEELAARGLTNIRNNGAEDLAAANFVTQQELRAKYPGWGEDKDQIDTGKGYRIVEAARGLIDRGKGNFLERPDWKYGWARYIELHDAFTQELDALKMAGRSGSLKAQENADLLAAWEYSMGELVQSNPMFADAYHRYLESHIPNQGTYAVPPEEGAQ